MPRESSHVLYSAFNSHSFIVGGLNCFFTQRLLNLLLTTKKGNVIANRQSSETAKIVSHVLIPCLVCLSSLSMIFLSGEVEVTPRLKFFPVTFSSVFHPFHVFCCVPQIFLRGKFGWALDFSWPVPNQASSYEQKPGANSLGSFLLSDLKDISVF